MTQPYFSIGEEVLLESTAQPKYNGEYVVADICTKNDWANELFEMGVTGTPLSNYYYRMEGLSFMLTIPDSGRQIQHDLVAEKLLRKKHKPSGESFSELMINYMEPVNG